VTAPLEIVHAVTQFLYREARLLDERRWDEWLALWTEDARYQVPTRHTPYRNPRDPGGHDASPAAEINPPGDLWWVDDSLPVLSLRVAKLRTGTAWAEDPPSRTRRFVTNIEVTERDAGDLDVRSNLLLYRSRREVDVEWLAGGRHDVLVPLVDGVGFAIRSRRVLLDAMVLPASDLAVFL
jgi:3-phenylpropionate/cinnamic acid dioxygenase small subunit